MSKELLVTTARRTESSDAKEVVKFVNRSTIELFGPSTKEAGKLFEIIEKSILSITIEDQNTGRILAQASFNDYPNVYNVSPKSWETWMNVRYEASKNNTLNTLFLHFCASVPEFSLACSQEIIKSAFKAVPECHYLVLCVPINTVPEAALSNIFSEMKRKPKGSDTGLEKPTCAIFVANREKHIPVLHIRPASVNDNDDLIPLLNSYTEILKATYGNFYVAELIEAQNEHNKCLTSEAEGYGMGFMAITRDVNVTLLNECFELGPFHGLCKPHHDDLLISPENEIDENEENPMPEIKHKLSDGGIIDSQSQDDFSALEQQQEISNYNSSLNSPRNNQRKSKSFVPVYKGESNAFSIQLFCIEEQYDSRALDFLPKAFEAFPEKDFCVITLPPNVPEFALIQNFLRVTPRDTNKLNQELYVFHRAGLVKSFKVREANISTDYTAVEKLVHNMSSKESILRDLTVYMKSRKDPDGINVQAYVAEVLGRIVGIAIIRQEADIEYLRSTYNIEDFILYTHHKREEHGHINHFAVIPIFSFLTKYFIREVLRKSNKTCLYYPIYPDYCSLEIAEKYSLITAMKYMVPVRRRNLINYNFDRLKTNVPSSQVLNQKYNYQMPSALNHINRKLLLESKISINLRIVVVGASDIGISFLETLVFSPHLRFNNITLVSTNGLPGTLVPDAVRDNMKSHSMNYDQSDYPYLSLQSWINTIVGKMTSIDRRRKEILINDRTVLAYDHLILCTGEQYYPVAPLSNKIWNSYSKSEVKPSLSRAMFDGPPRNMFVINDEYDAENVLAHIEKNNLVSSSQSVVIYGMDLNTLCTIQAINSFGIDYSRFKVITGKNSLGFVNNPIIQAKVSEVLSELKIGVYECYQMDRWNDGQWQAGENIESVTFVKSREANQDIASPRSIEIKCCMLLCYYKKDVDYTTFKAANKCHLVYDGRLVIDNDFHTNDSCIRAGGKLTKYKRSYYVDSWSHANFNQREIGIDLAYRILKLVDPTLMEEQDPDEKTDSARVALIEPDDKVLIELYKKPQISYGLLPGGFYYLHVTKSGLPISYEAEKLEHEELVTVTENGYFRLHLNSHKCVQTITCLSRKKFSESNFIKLYGFHEQYLNRLLTKYSQNKIKDFYVYLSDHWCNAIYHDRFEELCKEIREITINPNNGIKSVNDLLNEIVDKDLILTKDQRNKITEHFSSSGTRSLIEKRLLSYLNYNSNHLPMFAKPDMV